MDGNGLPSAPLRGPGGPVPLRSIPLTAVHSTPAPPVSLTSPRPESDRRDNDYVETPLRTTLWPPSSPPPAHRPPAPAPPPQLPISKQPVSFSKTASSTSGVCEAPKFSVMCSTCGKCKCVKCRDPKQLPEYWLCNKSCLLSADSVIDYASCICCVKGLYYHCSESDDVDVTCADDPCSCGPDRRSARWGCLAALVCALPCLVFYWPLRGCKRGAELCYQRYSRRGCRCRPPRPPAKRLLGNDSLQDF